MPTMIARTLPHYGTKVLKPGEHFEVEDERHVKTLLASRKADLAETEDSKRSKYRRRDMTADK